MQHTPLAGNMNATRVSARAGVRGMRGRGVGGGGVRGGDVYSSFVACPRGLLLLERHRERRPGRGIGDMCWLLAYRGCGRSNSIHHPGANLACNRSQFEVVYTDSGFDRCVPPRIPQMFALDGPTSDFTDTIHVWIVKLGTSKPNTSPHISIA
jgi:hypothetical protein